jgi:hypothetical protein
MYQTVECPSCFQKTQVDRAQIHGGFKCLKCGMQISTEDDPTTTYEVGVRPCPSCGKDCTPEVVICIECGYDFQSRTKHRTRHQPFHASWESALSFGTRFLLFGIIELLLIATFVFGWRVGAMAFGVGTLCAGFLLGSFQLIVLSRSPEGKSTLWINRRVFFFPWSNRTLNLKHYKHVVLGYAGPNEDDTRGVRGFLYDDDGDYSTESYSLSIVRVDGESTVVCRGWDEAETREIGDALCKIGGLHYG